MQPDEFIVLSGKLAAMNLGAAGARSAVSRAYYGAFHLAMKILDEFATAPPANGQGHNLVPAFLESAGNEELSEAASLLQDLHSARIKVDYRIGDLNVESAEYARAELEVAHEIQSRLATYAAACRSSETVRTSLIEGVAKTRAQRKC